MQGEVGPPGEPGMIGLPGINVRMVHLFLCCFILSTQSRVQMELLVRLVPREDQEVLEKW